MVLTKELLESHYHESLDAVVEILGLSKTTIKAACRRLGLPKWPYQHTGPRKRRMSQKPEHPAESEHERALKATFHSLMGNTNALAAFNEDMASKRQRMGDTHLDPNILMGQQIPLPPNANLADLQAMQLQSLSALSAMVTALNASGQQLQSGQQPPLNSGFPGPPPFQGQPQVGDLPPLNYGGNYGGNYMHEAQGGFHQQAFPGHLPQMVNPEPSIYP